MEVASEAIPIEDASPGANELRAGLLSEAELMGLPDAVIGRLRP